MLKHVQNYQSVCQLPQCSGAVGQILTKSGETMKSLQNNRYHRCERPNFKLCNLVSFTRIENISKSENTCF